ncbi:LOW QUALITY PROTEIN: centrosomal protein of 55 kDa [Centropristis striata]|uniref:LOW QUALITY PROTEIN: centrosomal protein of 55 kDa n=1 Tax=Centropristis striata TaxID=184440 RepID=UPI0027E1F94F|nr:LOW QUALITY PROTEIN: centrosomal protein of 55 kDa [Centropristis striata]
MASSKYKGSPRKKLNSELEVVVSSLRNENDYLKKTLVELSRQHSEHNKLLERVLSFETVRLESCQQLTAKDKKISLPPEQLSKKEESLMDADSASDEWGSSNTVIELQNHLRDALEKNKQWLEYDQQREAYVRDILARMLWLEKQLNEANQARSQQHNEDHSDGEPEGQWAVGTHHWGNKGNRLSQQEKWKIIQMQEYYERLLQKAKKKAEVLTEQLDMALQNLTIIKNQCKEREIEVEELKQQLQAENTSRKSALEDRHCSQDEEQWMTAETEDLQCRLDDEKRRSTNFELQLALCQKSLLNQHHEDQEKIAELERQIKISSQDLEDEKQDSLYLKKQMFRVLKLLKTRKDHVMEQSKRDHQDGTSCEVAHPPSLCSRDSLTCTPHSSLLNESFLECPNCHAEYPASHYQELMIHLDICPC